MNTSELYRGYDRKIVTLELAAGKHGVQTLNMDQTIDTSHILGEDDESESSKTYTDLQPVPFVDDGSLIAYLCEQTHDKYGSATEPNSHIHDLIDIEGTHELSYHNAYQSQLEQSQYESPHDNPFGLHSEDQLISANDV